MDNSPVSAILNVKVKIFIFFAYILFGGLAALFLYYKTLGGVGFSMSAGFFDMGSGSVNLLFSTVAILSSFAIKQKEFTLDKLLFGFVSILVFGFVLNQVNLWLEKYNEGLFAGGELLKSLSVDDILYFTFYYIITFFQVILATIVASSYLLIAVKGENSNSYLNRFSLFQILEPLYFSIVYVFIFYHVWN